jgi:hypothetical protein
MKNRVLLISGISALAGGLAWYLVNRSKQARRLQPSINSGNNNIDGQSLVHKIMRKAKIKTGG